MVTITDTQHKLKRSFKYVKMIPVWEEVLKYVSAKLSLCFSFKEKMCNRAVVSATGIRKMAQETDRRLTLVIMRRLFIRVRK